MSTLSSGPVIKAAFRIANEYPIVTFGVAYHRSCHHCGRDVEDYMRNVVGFDYRHRQVHEPGCSWIELRDALGIEPPPMKGVS